VVAYGQLVEYDPGILIDDLYINLLSVVPENKWVAERTEWAFDRALGATPQSAKLLRVAALVHSKSVDRATLSMIAKLRNEDLPSLEAQAASAASAEVTARDAALKQVEAAQAEALTKSGFARWNAIATPLSLSDVPDWALPAVGGCAPPIPGEDEEKRKNSSEKAKLAKEWTTRVFSAKLDLKLPSGEKDSYDPTKGLPVLLSYSSSEHLGLSPRAVIKSENMLSAECCDVLTGDCRSPDGWVNQRCNAREVMRKRSMGVSSSVDDDSLARRVLIRVTPEDASKISDAPSKAKVAAVVRLVGVQAACGDESTRVILGSIVALQVSAASTTVSEYVEKDRPLAEAKLGAEAWLKSKLAPAGR
jgi:hypothetical protein